MELESYRRNLLDCSLNGIKKVILCLNHESFKEELDKYNIDGGALIEKNENIEEYGDIVFNISTTVKIIAPKSGAVSCVICIKNAVHISSILLSAILAREITNVLDIVKREKDGLTIKTASFAAHKLMESALRFIDEVKTSGAEYQVFSRSETEGTIMEEEITKEDEALSNLHNEAMAEAIENKDWTEEEEILNSDAPVTSGENIELKLK